MPHVKRGMVVVNPDLPPMDDRTFLATSLEFMRALHEVTLTADAAEKAPPHAPTIILLIQLGEFRQKFYSQADAAQALGISTSSCQRACDWLRENDLVNFEPHPSDGRKVILHATARAWAWMRQVFERCIPVVAEEWRRQLAHFYPDSDVPQSG